MTIRILLVDDHRITREGLRALLETEEEMSIVAEAEDGRAALRFVEEFAPDVVVMDVSMPELNGVEGTRRILALNENVRVLGLSMFSAKQFVAQMMEAGASGYLLKDCASEELTKAIRIVAEGGTYLGEKIAPVVVQDYVQSIRDRRPFHSALTPREREVLQLISEGHSTKEVAFKLNVSTKTVETHRRNIMEKLKIDNVAELTKFAVREGLTDLQ